MLYFSSPAHPRPYNIIVLMIIYYIITGMYTVCAIIERASIIFRKPGRRWLLHSDLISIKRTNNNNNIIVYIIIIITSAEEEEKKKKRKKLPHRVIII